MKIGMYCMTMLVLACSVSLFGQTAMTGDFFHEKVGCHGQTDDDYRLHRRKRWQVGGWLGGALQWHLTFMWIYLATGVIYLGYQLFSGHYRQVTVHSPRLRGRVAYGAPVFFIRSEAAAARSL